MEVDYERESDAWTEFVLGEGGPHALRTALGHRADPVCGRIRCLGAQPLISPQVRTHKHRRPDRKRDRGVAFGANRSNREYALQSCSVYTIMQAGSRRSGDGVEPLGRANELPGTGCVRWHTDEQFNSL